MRFSLQLAVVLCAALSGVALHPATPGPPERKAHDRTPTVNKATLANYLRYAEGYAPQVEISVDDPKPSMFPGLFELLVHLKAGKNEAVRTYYLSEDSKRVVTGQVFELDRSPFEINLLRLKDDGSPVIGGADARVKIFVFSDFECPYCREEAKTLRQNVAKQHPKDVKIVFKNFPLESIHPWARSAAISGVCIAQQKMSSFWAFHDWIYEHQSEINVSNLKEKTLEFAKGEALDTNQLTACAADPASSAQVDKTIAEGRVLGVVQTPTLFVNGRLVSGSLPAEQMELLVQMELQHSEQQKTATNSNEKCCEVAIPTVGKR
jgi:protein-disulfide isomerase